MNLFPELLDVMVPDSYFYLGSMYFCFIVWKSAHYYLVIFPDIDLFMYHKLLAWITKGTKNPLLSDCLLQLSNRDSCLFISFAHDWVFKASRNFLFILEWMIKIIIHTIQRVKNLNSVYKLVCILYLALCMLLQFQNNKSWTLRNLLT